MKKLLLIAMAAPLMACGVDSAPPPDTLPDLPMPEAPAPGTGWQILSPIVDNIQPGADLEMCTWTNVFADKDYDMRSTVGYQTEPPGHHVILFYTTITQPANTTRVCNDADMATFRFLAPADGEGGAATAPGNLVYHIPKGAQIVLNHHYLNVTDHVARGQAVVNVNFADPAGGPYTPVGYVAITNTSLQVQEGDTTQTMHAVLDRDYKVWQMIPHEHQWGARETIVTTHNGVATTQFDVAWSPSYAFHPPQNIWDPSQPYIMSKGDTVDVTCEWNNTSGMVLPFGFEMCVAFMNTVDDDGAPNWAWDDGTWGPF